MTTDSLLDQVQKMLNNLSQDIHSMSDTTRRHSEMVMTAIDDIATHMLAMQAIVVAILKQNPVELNGVLEWIDTHTNALDKTGQGTEKAKTLARYLVNYNS